MAVVRGFALSSLIWGAVGMLVGLLAALQLAWPELNWGPYLHFGRIRPIHTNAVIFGFTLGVVFAGSYYGIQRLCRVRMFSDTLSRINLWGWNAIIVAAAVSLLLGKTTSKEYAELEWPIDIAIAVVWVVYAVNVFGTLARRREKSMYAAIWFWIATVVTIAMLHIVNSMALPVSWMKSYSAYAGVFDANIQWWYGHNAVGFLLTTPILGLMYYFLPKQAGRPIYSHRLSILHFWSLIFIYIWAGPHHLIYSPLPDWAQTFGTAFSIALIFPSWGGMLNGLLTLRGAWHKVRTDPLLKMFADDGGQDGELALALHQLDGRPRAFGGARLGGAHLFRHALLPHPSPVAHEAVQPGAGRGALLDRDPGNRPLRDADVDLGGHPGPDVASGERGREPHLHLHRVGGGDPHLRRDPSRRRGRVPGRRAGHALERLHDHSSGHGRSARTVAPRGRACGRRRRRSLTWPTSGIARWSGNG
jgi:hypothetical protein